ncbi:MAG TPA: glycosyl hydrolase, partial [Flavobacteriaceae bacterium]|nr:glycosyl hydrolase [Flavobacteriaceae bacterium]
CTIFAAAESPITEGLLWTGSDDGLVHITRNGGKTWENVTPKGMPEWMMINSIEPSRFDAGTCYIAGTKYKTGDFAPYLYKTTDYGKTWKKITNGIPAEHFTRVLREDETQKGLLYAGTEAGMYISFNDGETWQAFQLNLPIVPITDLALKDNNLIVATQGRSLWVMDDLTVLHQLNKAKGVSSSAVENFLFKPKDSYRMDGRSRKGSLTTGTNHPNGVMVYFNLEDPSEKEVSLSFLKMNNDTIKTFSSKGKKDKISVKKGGNLFVWDTEGDGAERLDGMILWWASTDAPKAVPGTYKVVLKVGEETLTQNFAILPDQNAETDIAGMQRQFDFITDINKTVDKAHKSIKKIRKINAQLEDFQKQYKDNDNVKDLVEKAKKLSEDFSEIEKALYQTKNRSGQDPLNFPIKLTNKLAHLNSLVRMDDFPPTQQDILVKNELTDKINEELMHFEILVSSEIKAFNEQFNALKLNYLFIEEEK